MSDVPQRKHLSALRSLLLPVNWNEEEKAWQVEPAQYVFEFGSSSSDIRGSAEVWLG